MRVNIFLTLLLLLIAVAMYALPASVLQDFRLILFNQYESLVGTAQGKISDLSNQPKVLSSSVSPEIQLKELNVTLDKKDSEIAFLKKQLRELTDFKDVFPAITISSARVVSESSRGISPELVIDKGYLDGVVEGAAVAQGSILAGMVVRVERNTSIVLRTDSENILVPGRAGKSRDRCSVKGDGYENAIAVFYTGQTASMVGEKIYTSSALGKVPEGLLIGVLEDYPQKGSEPGTLEAPVKLDADFTSLEQVIVISEF